MNTEESLHAIAGLSDAQAYLALSVFAHSVVGRAGGSMEELLAAAHADETVFAELRKQVSTGGGIAARATLQAAVESDVAAVADEADQAALKAESSGTLHMDPVTGAVIVGVAFIVMLKSINKDGLVMRDKMPAGFPEALKQAAALAEKLGALADKLKN